MPSQETVDAILATHGLKERYAELWDAELIRALAKRIAELEKGEKPETRDNSPELQRLLEAAEKYAAAVGINSETPISTFVAAEGELKAAAVRYAAARRKPA